MNEPWWYTDLKYIHFNIQYELDNATDSSYKELLVSVDSGPCGQMALSTPSLCPIDLGLILVLTSFGGSTVEPASWFYPHCPPLSDGVDVMLVIQISNCVQGGCSVTSSRDSVLSITTTTCAESTWKRPVDCHIYIIPAFYYTVDVCILGYVTDMNRWGRLSLTPSRSPSVWTLTAPEVKSKHLYSQLLC